MLERTVTKSLSWILRWKPSETDSSAYKSKGSLN